MLFAILGMSSVLLADTTKSCKISGGKDGATVVASITEIWNGYVMFELSNYGDFNVNVTVTINSKQGKNYQRGTQVPAQGGKSVKVVVPEAKSEDNINSYDVSTVKGQRCN